MLKSLRTAIDIKNAIDSAKDKLNPIGTCDDDYISWRIEESGLGEEEYHEVELEMEDSEDEVQDEEDEDDSEREDDKKDNSLTRKYKLHYHFSKIVDCLDGVNYKEFQIPQKLRKGQTETEEEQEEGKEEETEEKETQILKIKKGEEVLWSGGLEISQPTLKKLFEKGLDSPYGDMKNIETKVDKDVRNAKELTEIEVSEEVLNLIKEQWKENLYPPNVKVVPYKLNMYTQDGFFKPHRDTPEKDMVGTALISLWGNDANNIGNFRLEDPAKKIYHSWKPDTPECLMFYTDCPHEVQKSYSNYSYNSKTTRKEDCIRATISFKIYEENSPDVKNGSKDMIKAERISRCIKKLMEQSKNERKGEEKEEKGGKGNKLGFILSHDYSLDINSLKGDDALILQAVKLLGVDCKLVPILQHFYLSSYHESSTEDEYSSKVYLLSEQNIDYLLQRESDGKEIEVDPLNSELTDVTFYNFKRKLFEWSSHTQQYSSYTGNESAPEQSNSVYISRAIIF